MGLKNYHSENVAGIILEQYILIILKYKQHFLPKAPCRILFLELDELGV